MRTSRIISGALAALMVASTLAVGSISASAASVKKPTKVKAVNTKKTIKITWKKVKGADKYKVYRGKKLVKTVKKAKYTDKKVKAGKTYKYAVKAVKDGAVSKASKKAKVVRLKQPKISSAKVVANGIKITWKKVKGAKKYHVFKKTTGKFAKCATVTAKSYTDKKAASGVATAYAVKAVNGKSKSIASKATAKLTYLAAVAAVKAETAKNSKTVKLTWAAVKGATGYSVVDKAGKKVADVTATTYEVTPDVKNISILTYSVIATKGAVKSVATPVQFGFIPEGSYTTDADKNVHAKVELKVGEKYEDGAIAKKLVSQSGAVIKVEDVNKNGNATLADDYTITAVKVGTEQFKVTFDKKTADLLNAALKGEGYAFGNDLSTLTAYVDVTVVA